MGNPACVIEVLIAPKCYNYSYDRSCFIEVKVGPEYYTDHCNALQETLYSTSCTCDCTRS